MEEGPEGVGGEEGENVGGSEGFSYIFFLTFLFGYCALLGTDAPPQMVLSFGR